MNIRYSAGFESGEYAATRWICSDGIYRETIYKVVKRTPKRVTLAAIYPNGLDRPVTMPIERDGLIEVAYDKGRNYGRVIPAQAVN